MALIADTYSDSDEDDDINMDDCKAKKQESSKKKLKSLPKPFTPSPPKKISWKKKRSYGNYTANCKNDYRGTMTSSDPNNENYNIESMPHRKRRELMSTAIPNTIESIFNDTMYNPIIAKKGNKQKSKQPNNKMDNPFFNHDWNQHNKQSNLNHNNNDGNASSLQFKPRQIKPNTTNASIEDLGNMWSKSCSKQFTNHHVQ